MKSPIGSKLTSNYVRGCPFSTPIYLIPYHLTPICPPLYHLTLYHLTPVPFHPDFKLSHNKEYTISKTITWPCPTGHGHSSATCGT